MLLCLRGQQSQGRYQLQAGPCISLATTDMCITEFDEVDPNSYGMCTARNSGKSYLSMQVS